MPPLFGLTVSVGRLPITVPFTDMVSDPVIEPVHERDPKQPRKMPPSPLEATKPVWPKIATRGTPGGGGGVDTGGPPKRPAKPLGVEEKTVSRSPATTRLPSGASARAF